jgi:predicted nucleotidyltransferase
VTTDAVTDALRDAVSAFERAEIPYVLIGGLASTVHGRPRATLDIDFLVREGDAKEALKALSRAGFSTEETNPQWIYKASRDNADIDLIFWLKGDVYLDDEMLARATEREVEDVQVRVIPPEDLIVVKAVIHDEQTPRHWGDALAVIADTDLDWEYLARRARKGVRRVLALLIYAHSNDLVVNEETIRSLFAQVYAGNAP